MKATATCDFTALVNGREFACVSGDEIEADKATIGQLEAIGAVTTKPKKKGGKPRKEGTK